MKEFLFFLSLCFLLSCFSSDKADYDSVMESPSKSEKHLKRDVAYLKQVSQVKEESFQFISKQMKEMVQNYQRLKKQLEKIERKLDQFLMTSSEKTESFLPPIIKDKNSIILTKKNKERVIMRLSNIEDYTKLMAQILRGEYDISEEEKEKLLLRVKKRINKKQEEETVVGETVELLDIEDLEDLDEEGALPGDSKDDFFDKDPEADDNVERDQDIEEDIEEKTDTQDKRKENSSPFVSAKKHFDEQSYETAISEFQKYRNENPEGIYYPEATFYIGQSFKKLKMPIEAKVFFKEIVQSHPQSLWASRAKEFLKK